MKLDEYQQRLKVAIALGEGKECECRSETSGGPWSPLTIDPAGPQWSPGYLFHKGYEVRVKPAPKLVPWASVAEVPVNDWFRRKMGGVSIYRIVSLHEDGIRLFFSDYPQAFENVMKNYEHAADPINGPWFPCGREVPE